MDPVSILVKVFKLLLPFLAESLMGKDSLISYLKKNKVFTFIVISNVVMFATIAFLAEQNFIFLEAIRERNRFIKEQQVAIEKVTDSNKKLLLVINGDVDSMCYDYLEEQFKANLPTETFSNKNNNKEQTE